MGNEYDTKASTIPLEKSSPNVEASYRKAGLQTAANAVRLCREEGSCNRLLTEKEAWVMFGAGRSAGGLNKDEQSGTGPSTAVSGVAVAGLTAPALSPGAAGGAVAKTAVERAALRWGTAEVISGGAAVAEGGTAAAAGTSIAIAAPVALGAYVVVGIVALVSWSKFQAELQRQGYIILPEILGVCIGNCHQPGAPKFELRFSPDTFSPQPFPRKFSPEEMETLKDWINPKTSTQPVSPPLPKAQPKEKEEEDKKKDCRKVRRTTSRGDDPLAELFCSVVSLNAPSYDIYSKVGVAEIDALAGTTWYECKCGYRSTVRAFKRGERWAKFAIDKLDEQIRRQTKIAGYCGYQYRLFVANKEVEDFFRDRYADIDVVKIDFEPCE